MQFYFLLQLEGLVIYHRLIVVFPLILIRIFHWPSELYKMPEKISHNRVRGWMFLSLRETDFIREKFRWNECKCEFGSDTNDSVTRGSSFSEIL